MTSPSNSCSHCGIVETTEREQVFRDGTRHRRIECGVCGRWIKYAPKAKPRQWTREETKGIIF